MLFSVFATAYIKRNSGLNM